MDSYLDAVKDFPDSSVNLKTKEEEYFHFKTDIFKGIFWYICKQDRMKMVAVPVKRVKQLHAFNKKGEFPEELIEVIEEAPEDQEMDYLNVVGQDDLTRFDKLNKRKKKRPNQRKNNHSNQKKAQTREGGKFQGKGGKNTQQLKGDKSNQNRKQVQGGKPNNKRKNNRQPDKGRQPKQSDSPANKES